MSGRELHLCEPLLDSGIEDIAFWNGRILTAEDLADQRDAHVDRARLLGRALGEGVANGLFVQRVVNQPTVVEVRQGLAVSRRGDVLRLPIDIRLRLVPAAGESAELGGFADCEVPDLSGTYTGEGFYLLLVGPGEGTRDSAPAVTFDSDGIVKRCGPKYEVDGIRFRLVQVDVVGAAESDGHDSPDLIALTAVAGAVARSRRRNVLAHVLLGTQFKARLPIDLYGGDEATYGPVDELRATGDVDDGEVPLAAISWVADGVEFVDCWAVRRHLHRPLEFDDGVAALTACRARAEGAAGWHQFRDHVSDMITSPPTGGLSQVRVGDHFRYLPAAGCVPVAGGGWPGLDGARFFDGVPVADATFIPGSAVARLLRAGFDVAPFDTASGEALWIHEVSENARVAASASGPQRYLAFARVGMPREASARFDLGRFDYSNFAPRDVRA